MRGRGRLLALLLGAGITVAGANLLGRIGSGTPIEGPAVGGSESPADRGTAAPVEDPEALAAWFQAEVMRELERPATGGNRGPGAGYTPRPRVAAMRGLEPPATGESRGPAASDTARHRDTRENRMIASLKKSRRYERVDWDYLDDVFAGRVNGIPNERRAGLSLREMDALGEVPYLERLRDEGRFDEMRELDVVEEPAPLLCPALIDTGARRDYVCGIWLSRQHQEGAAGAGS